LGDLLWLFKGKEGGLEEKGTVKGEGSAPSWRYGLRVPGPLTKGGETDAHKGLYRTEKKTKKPELFTYQK